MENKPYFIWCHQSEHEKLHGTNDQMKNCEVYSQNISISAIQWYSQPLMSRVIILLKKLVH